MLLKGIIPPVVTPLRADESLDLDGLRAHIDFLLGKGVHGIFVLGTTGEFYALSEDEKQAVVACAVTHVNGRSRVYAGTGAETTREVVRLTKMAEKEGADGVSVITPYFIKPSQAELIDHFRRVADSTSKPVVLYNNPATCGGVSIEPDTVARLAETPHIVGIKDSSGDLQNTIELIKVTPRDKFAVLNGRDTLLLAALMFGASGAIPATCNIAPEFCVGIYESFTKGDLPAARRYQDLLAPVRLALTLATGNGAVKEAMALLGRPAGPNRGPISALPADKREKLKAILTKVELM
ncbi:4-hydroxy-tetrahydrodipicolinate synthase [Fimbriiglobus ruber]|uniref:4-hydroxy-tetrahydrodipicolinate synthase n=1 Tax=Fimbriiglobus ruber TaxID=1908690 RepID=A0A225DSX8_9BACT|nr:4-hydroxy-tetrahydrodipicolinate synthase [Fimbriiglobus ruber]OWK44542.1 4-hydroxy-tetrahydrodipicolinate synthase [Fimbriiglobus ruber]